MAHMDLIDSQEAARLLGVSKATLNRRAVVGELPTAARTSGGRGIRLFDRALVEQMAREGVTRLSQASDETRAAS